MNRTKKILVAVLALVLAAAVLSGCNVKNSSETSSSYNGYTRTEKTVTENGKTIKEVIYTGPDGSVLDEAYGEAAFQAAKEGKPIPEPAPQLYTANLRIVNNLGVDLTEFHMYLDGSEENGQNWLQEPLKDGTEYVLNNFISYYTDSVWGIDVASGEPLYTFSGISITKGAEEVTLTLSVNAETENWHLDIAY